VAAQNAAIFTESTWQETTPIDYNAAMKLQFSLTTLLVCVTVLAVLCVVCVQIPVVKPHHFTIMGQPMYILTGAGEYADRPPTTSEIFQRLAIVVPLSIAATLAVLWTIRRLKPCRHTKPSVG
jgi:hypothetical protein